MEESKEKVSMKYKRLGNTGLRVSEICLGTMTFSHESINSRGLPGTDEATSHAILDRFVELGGNFIDTADVYSSSEEVIGNWLSKKPEGFRQTIIISTKFRSATEKSGINDRGGSRKHIHDAIERSLKRLQTTYIDLYQIHVPDTSTPLEETLQALNDLIRQGKVHYIGCSNFASWQIQKAIDISERDHLNKFVTLQQQYSLLCRTLEWDILDVCRNEGLGILTWSPLAGGWLSGKYDRSKKAEEDSRVAWASKAGATQASWSTKSSDSTTTIEQIWNIIDELRAIAKELNTTVSSVALRWLLQRPGVTSIIIGSKKMEQFEQNMEAINIHLSDEQMKRLTKVSDSPLPYPYNIIAEHNIEKND